MYEPEAVQQKLLESIADESMTGFIQPSKNMETLQSEDTGNAIIYAIQLQNHVDVNEILIIPTRNPKSYQQANQITEVTSGTSEHPEFVYILTGGSEAPEVISYIPRMYIEKNLTNEQT